MSRKCLAVAKLDSLCIFHGTILEVPRSFFHGVIHLLVDWERFLVAS